MCRKSLIVTVILFAITVVVPSRASETVDISDVVNANNQFCIDFYSKVKDTQEGNIFFSPYSISTAFSMVYEGARGDTAKEMQSVFHFPQDNELHRNSVMTIYDQMNNKDAMYELYTANALWIQNDFKILDEYSEIVRKYYDGSSTNLDFKKDPEGSRKTINKWIEEKTKDKIKDLFPEESIDKFTRLVLTNAVYFKGNWYAPFSEEETKEEEFRVSRDKKIKVSMMNQKTSNIKFSYMETNSEQVLEMIYKGGDISMLVILPRADDLSALEESLSTEKLYQWRKRLYPSKVNISIPKFTFKNKYTLNDTLMKMGMPLAFEMEKADFSGIDGTNYLYIASAIHEAFVDVNEKGTEAVGVTAVSIYTCSVTKIFRADHPFIFLIQDRASGNILFFGRVVEPA